MNKEKLIKMFDERFNVEPTGYNNGETYFFSGINNEPSPEEIKQFIFETIIPNVLKSIIPEYKTCDTDENGDFYLENGIRNRNTTEYYFKKLYEIKQKAKDLYGIDL